MPRNCMWIGLSLLFVWPVLAEERTVIHSLSDYSPPKIELEWTVPGPVSEATCALFWDHVKSGELVVWKPVPGWIPSPATSTTFQGSHGEEYQFRIAKTSPPGREMMTLVDYERKSDMRRFTYFGYQVGINGGFEFETENPIEGKRSMTMYFQRGKKEYKDLAPDIQIGFPYIDTEMERDWSSFRYLEFLYWLDAPSDMNLFIRSASKEWTAPVLSFSETGDALRQWHSIVVDLDQEFGSPEERTQIKSLAFLIPEKQVDQKQGYSFKLDTLRLWASRDFYPTQIDATPPPLPRNIEYQIQNGKIEWTWDAPEEDLSEIKGYAYDFVRNRNMAMPDQILTTETQISFPFQKPPYYAVFYFRIRAQNTAGVWSDVVTKSVVCKP